MRKQNSKRGSTLVVSIFLLVFLLALGGGLLQWGIHNVSTTVQARAAQQAYYAAKSAVDAVARQLAEDEAALEALDETLKGIAQDAVLEGVRFTADADLGVDKDDAGNPLLTLRFACTECPDDIENGVQKLVLTARATCGGYSREVSRTLTIKRSKGSGSPAIIGSTQGLQNQNNKESFLENVVIKGGMDLESGQQIAISGTNTIDAPVHFSAPVISHSGTGSYGVGGEIILNAQNLTISAASMTTGYGNLKLQANSFPVISTELEALKNISESFSEAPYNATAEPVEYEAELPQIPATPLVASPDTAITESGTLKANGSVAAFEVDTRGGTLNILLETTGSTVFQGDITCTGDGTVNFYTESSKLHFQGAGETARLRIVGTGDTRVNVVMLHNAGEFEVNNVYSENTSFIAPDSHISMENSDVLSGFLWGATLQLKQVFVDASSADASGAVPGLTAGTQGVAGQTVLEAERGAYLAPEQVPRQQGVKQHGALQPG